MTKPLYDSSQPTPPDLHAQFEQVMLPHLDAAYTLARWLTRNDHDAEDLVQLSYLRAMQYFDGFKGGNARAWILTIVRNAFYSGLRGATEQTVEFDDGVHQLHDIAQSSGQEQLHDQRDTRQSVHRALEQLPVSFREVIVLKEMEDMTYQQIADVAGIPIGTVMSRLARARKQLCGLLRQAGMGGKDGV